MCTRFNGGKRTIPSLWVCPWQHGILLFVAQKSVCLIRSEDWCDAQTRHWGKIDPKQRSSHNISSKFSFLGQNGCHKNAFVFFLKKGKWDNWSTKAIQEISAFVQGVFLTAFPSANVPRFQKRTTENNCHGTSRETGRHLAMNSFKSKWRWDFSFCTQKGKQGKKTF